MGSEGPTRCNDIEMCVLCVSRSPWHPMVELGRRLLWCVQRYLAKQTRLGLGIEKRQKHESSHTLHPSANLLAFLRPVRDLVRGEEGCDPDQYRHGRPCLLRLKAASRGAWADWPFCPDVIPSCHGIPKQANFWRGKASTLNQPESAQTLSSISIRAATTASIFDRCGGPVPARGWPGLPPWFRPCLHDISGPQAPAVLRIHFRWRNVLVHALREQRAVAWRCREDDQRSANGSQHADAR